MSARRLASAVAFALLLLAASARAQTMPPPPDQIEFPAAYDDAHAAAEAAAEKASGDQVQGGPGFDDNGELAFTGSLKAARTLHAAGDGGWCSFGEVDGKIEYSAGDDATNHGELASAATLFRCNLGKITDGGHTTYTLPKRIWGPTLDVRWKKGTFEQKATTTATNAAAATGTATTATGEQLLGGLLFFFEYLDDQGGGHWRKPRLTAGYYHVFSGGGTLSLPKGIEVDQAQVKIETAYVVWPGADKDSWKKGVAVAIELRGSAATEGEERWDWKGYAGLGLEVGLPVKGETPIAATLRWESGKDPAFKYDRKVLGGLILKIAGF